MILYQKATRRLASGDAAGIVKEVDYSFLRGLELKFMFCLKKKLKCSCH